MLNLLKSIFNRINSPENKSPAQIHMESIKVGDKVCIGEKINGVVVENSVDWWDDEHLCPEIVVWYVDDTGRSRKQSFSPREALVLIRPLTSGGDGEDPLYL